MRSQRSLIVFYNRITSEQTRERHSCELEKFRDFFKIRYFDSLPTIDQKNHKRGLKVTYFFSKERNSEENAFDQKWQE